MEGERTHEFCIRADEPASAQLRFGFALIDADYYPVWSADEPPLEYTLEIARPRLCLNGFDLVDNSGCFLELTVENAQILVPLREGAKMCVNQAVLSKTPLEVTLKT